MQLPLVLSTFEYENRLKVRSITVNGEPWFYALDICRALAIANPSDAVGRLDGDDIGTTEGVNSLGRKATFSIVNESGLYNLVFESRKEEAKKFKRWITKEVLPQIRKTGGFRIGGSALPVFIRRFNDNWDRTDEGYFSVLSELTIRLYGRLEHEGYVMPDKSAKGTEMRPDVSVGIRFSKWLSTEHPDHCELRKSYRHLLPSGQEVEAYQYPRETLPLYLEYVDSVWIRDVAPEYFGERDPLALPYLPKLLAMPSVPPKAAANAFEKIKKLKAPPEKARVEPSPVATDASAKSHFAKMRAALNIRPKPEEPF